MRLGSNRAVAALALVFGVLGSSNLGAVRPEPLAEDAGLVTPVWTPLGVSKAPVTVVVQLAGDSVAEQQGNAGRKLDRSEKDRIKGQLKSQQDGLRGSIESLGGTVVASYQAAYNGIKVRIARDRARELAALPGVVAVRPLQLMEPDNVRGVPLIGTPPVWQSLGLHGEGVKIAIIDTGIDYTHANFGGPGTSAAYTAAHAKETLPADPGLFGPSAPRIKGGIDLVGDSYNASPSDPLTYQPIPHPDPNPLDCNGHGSHVAGTTAGSGVISAGTTYTGPYNASTLAAPGNFNIGPGVAPKADLYAVRVFGCQGSTDVTVDAIEWAVDNDMDVINMSLGSPFGSKDEPSAVASTNAAKAGVIVVASAGNSGPNQYITGSPATADGAIAVAANDPWPQLPAATIKLSSTVTVTAINANGYAFPSIPLAFTVKVIKDNPATTTIDESLGCSIADFGGPLPRNTIAVVNRGTCARVAKAIFGQQAGAAAVVMMNNAAGLPPFEGSITSNPDDGKPYTVTIPFLGVAQVDGPRLSAADGGATTVAGAFITNGNYTGFASFTSGGPRIGDSSLKPDIAAPGVSIISTGMGTGNAAATISGTSMSSPHVAGVAALTRQAHPTWTVEDIKAAIVNTGRPSGVLGYRTSRAGTGLAQPAGSTATQVVAVAKGGKFAASLNFGFEELAANFSKTKEIVLRNRGPSAATFNVAQARASGRPHSVSFSKTSVTVPAHGEAQVSVTLAVPAATAGTSNGAGLSFREVAGLVELTPSGADNAGVALRVPYYLVPRAQSGVATTIGTLSGTNPSTTATVTNKNGVIPGDADFYAWGIVDKPFTGQTGNNGGNNEDPENPSNDVRAIGVQSFEWDLTTQLLVFAVNTYNRWSNASTNEFDIYVDVDGDGQDDYIIVGLDLGAVLSGSFNGRMGSFVFSTRSKGASIEFLASAPTDSSTALLPVLSSQLCREGEPCLSASHPRLTYHAESFDLLSGWNKVVAGSAKYNAWSSAISFRQGVIEGGFATVAPGATDATVSISVNSAESKLTPALGVMVVTLDNKSGADEAQLILVDVK
jgi:subtilisin family serine protease